MVNNRPESITAYLLTIEGRNELVQREFGYSTYSDSIIEVQESIANDSNEANADDEEYYTRLFRLMDCTTPGIEGVCASESVFDNELDSEADDPAEGKSYKDWLIKIGRKSNENLLTFEPYNVGEMFQIGIESVRNIAARMNELAVIEKRDSEVLKMAGLFQAWLYHPKSEITFLRDSPRDSANALWRFAHRYQGWEVFVDLALIFISSGTSEADAERVLSMERYIAGLHGTRLGIRSMTARVRGLLANGQVFEEQVDSDSSDDDSDQESE
jgi:hypothetical protein